jgi:tetratricopeptide (TPR) repeat protein
VEQQRSTASFVWVYPVAFVLSLIILAAGVYLVATGKPWTLLAAGCVAVMGVLVSWPLALTIHGNRQCNEDQIKAALTPINERLEQYSVMLNTISEQQLLSDRAKSVAFREKDRDAVRRALQEEIAKQDWEAALVLVDEMERAYGYRQEADRFRQQINAAHDQFSRRQIADVVAVIDRHTRSEQWQAALREADRLRQMFPNNEQVKNLPVEIEARRQTHKKQLLDSWNEAVNRKDVDGAIEILKKLDLYLTPSEAESIQEQARTIFKQKMENLRTQFSVAVQDHNWQEAIRIGETIMIDFPNTQMAKEVREKMDALRQRANEPNNKTAMANA